MANKIYIVEGVDGMGKSTISKQICEKLNAKYSHCSWSSEINKHFMVEYWNKKWLEALDFSIYQPVVIDRHFISGIIYENVYRLGVENRSDIKLFCYKMIDTIQSSKNIIPIICTLPFEEWKKLFIKAQIEENKVEMYEMDFKLEQVYRAYNTLLTENKINDFEIKLNFQKHDFINKPFTNY